MRLLAIFLALFALSPAAAQNALPGGFVFLRDVAPGIAQEMRYATADNFTGHPLPGYGGRECVLRRAVAQALAHVEADLAREHLSLKVYDCYRPQRATRAMLAWARDGKADGNKRFYPTLDKRTLFSGYISAHSAHSTGTAVDLTLVPLAGAQSPAHSGASGATTVDRRDGPCTAPAAQRAPDTSLDMGTGFDCFDDRSHTRSGAITPAQRRARETLGAAMRKHGFRNYFREWWHFSYGATPAQVYDFPIPARR
ncbi:MAG TPA: M15 family metallopeptidase [Pseudolabrys sp.]|nr:M15 family metallopeptidase [Pseudolabrys sp.]